MFQIIVCLYIATVIFSALNKLMSDLIEIAGAILSASEKKLEVVSHNIANTGTSGYKSQSSFSEMISLSDTPSLQKTNEAATMRSTDFSQGRLTQTNSPLDFAISGTGLFKLRGGDDFYYSRQGHFQMVEGGRLMTAQGLYLQQEGGGDLVLGTIAAQVQPDGTILENGLPTSRIGVYSPKNADALTTMGGTLFRSDEANIENASNAVIRQGVLEAANVAVADQMTLMMGSIREAETGSRLVQTYDTLIGQAISTFGQGSR